MTAQPTPRNDELVRTLDAAIFAVTVSGNHGGPLLEAFAAVDRYLTAARATGLDPAALLARHAAPTIITGELS